MTGTELTADVSAERVRDTTVFARVSPEQKLRLVQASRPAGT
ncbi:hypothetical protein [Actinomadura sediminis]|uniref:Uncharacterized protein n=1 Tax=Actinomadura sediminis TaxID=1038904 RepID=A0ABW3EIB6_9ACTN